jgi:hypothetical protein
MKRQALTLVGVLSLLLAAGSAFAQTIHVRGNIPFSFIVNKETLPPGQYDIESLGAMDGKTLLIRDSNIHAKTLVRANAVESRNPSKQTKLVFNCRGNRYFLSQIWVEGRESGHQLPTSRREAEVAMDYAARQVVVLAQVR